MSPKVSFSRVKLTFSSLSDKKGGLLGFLSVVLNDSLVLDGLALRKTRYGKLTISYPTRVDNHGVKHFLIKPINDEVRRELELQILSNFRLEEF